MYDIHENNVDSALQENFKYMRIHIFNFHMEYSYERWRCFESNECMHHMQGYCKKNSKLLRFKSLVSAYTYTTRVGNLPFLPLSLLTGVLLLVHRFVNSMVGEGEGGGGLMWRTGTGFLQYHQTSRILQANTSKILSTIFFLISRAKERAKGDVEGKVR